MALTATQNTIIRRTAEGAFYTSLAARKPSIDIGALISTDSSTGSSKDYGWWGMPSLPREWVGPRQHKALRSYTDNLIPKRWEITVDVDRSTLEDDQTMQLSLGQVGAALAERAQEHVIKRFTEVMEAGNAGSIDTSWDGQFYFDTDHSFGNSGTVDNDLTGAAATGTDPTAAEAQAALGDTIEAMLAFPNDQGDPAGGDATAPFVIMIPPSYLTAYVTAFAAGGALSGGAIPGFDVSGVTGAFRGSRVVINPYLANADRTYVFRPTLAGAVGPFIFKRHTTAGNWEIDFEEDKESDIYVFRGRARYEIHYADFLKSCLWTWT